MRFNSLIFKVTFLLAFAFSFNGFGQILTFEFAGIAGSEASANSNTNDANISSSTITRGAGLTAAANGDRFNATGFTTSASIDLNDYFEYTITPNLGCDFSVSSVVMNFQRSGTGPRNFAIRSSVDSYVSDLATGTIADVTATASITFTFTQSNLASATTYRIYVYASEAAGGSGGIGDAAGNDLVVNGSTSCGPASPTITASPSSLSSFTYLVGAGPSAVQSFTTSGSNLTNDIVLNAPTNFEISTASGGPFSSSITLTQTAGTVAATPIFTRLVSALSINTYNGTIALTSTGATSLTVTLNGSVTGSAATDIITANGESATVSSLINTVGPLTSVQGTQVWQFAIRDGGAGLNDGDNLPSILTDLTFSQAAGDAIGDWSETIQAISLFDGATNVGNGVVISNQVQFTGLTISVADNTQKTISVRLTVKCPVGSGALDGDDFGFQISDGNATFSATGSGKTTFPATYSANAQNALQIVGTELRFVQQPLTTPTNGTMSPAVTVSATDVCGNVDRDFTSNISITSTGTLTSSPIIVAAVNGTSTFGSLVHSVSGTGFVLNATATAITSATSSTFDISTTTALGAGDLAIVGMCVDMNACGGASSEDEISFVTFQDITPGTSIDITDNGFERVGCGSNTWGDGEGVIRITRTTSTLPKGAVVTLRIMNNTIFIPLQPDANWTITYPVGTSFNLNGKDEQVYLMQGGVWNNPGGASDATYTGGTLMFAINTYNAWTCNNNTTDRGDLPDALKCFSILPGIVTKNIKYTGDVTPASQKDWINRLNSVTNWTGSTTCATYTSQGLDYGGTAQNYTIISSGFTQGQWTGTEDTDWFNCNNWQNYIIPDASTNVVIDQEAINSCEVGVSTLTTNAVCSTINVNSNSATARNLSVINSASLTVGGNVAITKTLVDAPLSISVLNTSTFTCNNLTITGTAAGLENAQFNNKQSTSTVNINGNLTLNTGARLDLTDAANFGIVNLKGNYINNDSENAFKQTNSVVKFIGTGAQSISTNSFNEVFGNIQVNKASGALTLINNVEVENVVTYTKGLVNSSATALLIFRDNATHASVSNTSFTNGPVRKIGDDAFTFPIGKTSVYAPASITAPSVVTDHFTAEYFDSNPHPTYDNTLKDITIDHLSICEHWIINRTNGASNVSVNLSWNTPRSCGVTTLADMLVARWDGTMWKDHGNGGTTGAAAAGSVNSLGTVNAFSPFTLGSVSVLNPLPIEVKNFEALKNENKVDLVWAVNNNNKINYFEIWTSESGKDFVLLDKVNANNKYLTNKNYTTVDYDPAMGINYYKLKVVDVNGKITFSDIKSVNFNYADGIYIFPNPVELGNDLYINLQLIDDTETVEVTFIDQIGKTVWNEFYVGKKSIYINTLNLSKGVYFVNVKSKNQTVSKRIIVI